MRNFLKKKLAYYFKGELCIFGAARNNYSLDAFRRDIK
jgi:hypothetical protein